jgi:enolase
VGTVTEALEAMAVCRSGGYAPFVSHRSGETTDTFAADLAVSSGCGQLKAAADARQAGGKGQGPLGPGTACVPYHDQVA